MPVLITSDGHSLAHSRRNITGWAANTISPTWLMEAHTIVTLNVATAAFPTPADQGLFAFPALFVEVLSEALGSGIDDKLE